MTSSEETHSGMLTGGSDLQRTGRVVLPFMHFNLRCPRWSPLSSPVQEKVGSTPQAPKQRILRVVPHAHESEVLK